METNHESFTVLANRDFSRLLLTWEIWENYSIETWIIS